MIITATLVACMHDKHDRYVVHSYMAGSGPFLPFVSASDDIMLFPRTHARARSHCDSGWFCCLLPYLCHTGFWFCLCTGNYYYTMILFAVLLWLDLALLFSIYDLG